MSSVDRMREALYPKLDNQEQAYVEAALIGVSSELQAALTSLLYVVERSPLFGNEGYDKEDVRAYMEDARVLLIADPFKRHDSPAYG